MKKAAKFILMVLILLILCAPTSYASAEMDSYTVDEMGVTVDSSSVRSKPAYDTGFSFFGLDTLTSTCSSNQNDSPGTKISDFFKKLINTALNDLGIISFDQYSSSMLDTMADELQQYSEEDGYDEVAQCCMPEETHMGFTFTGFDQISDTIGLFN